ncbi:MAG: hypothetical protein DBY08_04205 [Clostridiales bacterium]|nr:MAG: hypothetical protein DBY08_04205 [Clostridiales bacterium]
MGFIKNGTDKYYYIRNLQNDIVGILDSSGTQVVEYAYDTWGKLESVTGAMAETIGRENPLRYRGYYYDEETGFYYLQSRYYDPETGRFLNADETVLTGQGITSGNMYAYCANNPVMNYDPSGCFWLPFIVPAVKTVIKMACMVADVVSGIINNGPSSKKFDTMDEAATDWSKKYKPKSETREKGAIIYKITGKDNKTQYTYGRTYNGYNSNVISGFVMGYTTGLGESAISPRKEMVAFVHSHPKPESEYLHDDFPSKADLFLLNLPGIEEVYVVPYKRCPLTPNLIRATDTAKWDYDGHISEE